MDLEFVLVSLLTVIIIILAIIGDRLFEILYQIKEFKKDYNVNEDWKIEGYPPESKHGIKRSK